MKNKEYRHGLINAQIEVDLPLQIRALRKQLVGTQPEMATLTGMKQPRISAMEKPGGVHFTLETLRRLAEAFDVALIVRFAPFSELLDWSGKFNPDTFRVPSFVEETQEQERTAEPQPEEAPTTTTQRPSIEQPAASGLGLSYPVDDAFLAVVAQIQRDQYERLAPYLVQGAISLGSPLITTHAKAVKPIRDRKPKRPKKRQQPATPDELRQYFLENPAA